MSDIILVYPPVAKPGEAPAGIARLAGHLRASGVACRLLDLNLEGLDFILTRRPPAEDTWSRRAFAKQAENRAFLSSPAGFANFARYRRAVEDLNRVVSVVGRRRQLALSLTDYQETGRTPLASRDLLRAAEHFEENIYFPVFSSRLTAEVESEAPAYIGFSLNYLSQALNVFAMIGFCRAHFPGVGIVLGGGLVTSWLSRPGRERLFHGLVDHLVAGPGEGPLSRIVGGGAGPGDGPETPAEPDYRELSRSGYLAPAFILPYAASSGCYWNRCAFCPERAENNPYRPLPAAQAASAIGKLAKKYRSGLLHLLDNAVSPALLGELIRNPPGVGWYGFVRADAGLEDYDFCRQLRASGCVMLKLGLESGSAAVLERMGKGLTPERAGRVLENLRRAGIATYVYLLFGTPAEGPAEARQTLEFVARQAGAVSFLNLAIFNLPLFSPESQGLEVRTFSTADLSLYSDFVHPRGFDRKTVRSFLDREFKRHPRIAPILRRDPPLFTSNHAPFFVPGQ